MKQLDLGQLLEQLKPMTDDRGLTAAERVYKGLYGRIINFDLEPDTTLSRTELCADYGVSQTPVREALQRLEQIGLVSIYPQSRTLVRRIEVGLLKQNHFLREALECEVVRRLAEQGDSELVQYLYILIAMQESLIGGELQATAFSRFDELFHETMFNAVGQNGLFLLCRSMSVHMERARRLDLPQKGKALTVVQTHRQVVDAIAARDAIGAMNAMHTHLTGTISRLDELREKYPDYFVD